MSQSTTNKAYLAGFLDGDGSIHVRLKPNNDYRYGFQVSPAVVFYQSQKEKDALASLQQEWECGYLRERNDGIVEWTIGDRASIRMILRETLPYLRWKKKQAQLMIDILDKHEAIENADDFLSVAHLIDRFKELNYSKKRTVNAERVEKLLRQKQLLAP